MKIRTTLELTINPEYVKNWDIWCAIRELIQNAADANDIGYPMHIEFKGDLKTPCLRIWNEGITIDRSTLLLGTTSKAGDARQRGQFGEGFKLAWLVILRMGRKIWCKSGNERWIPKFGHSATFGTELLQVDIAPVKYENIVLTEVELTAEEWENIQKRVVFLAKPQGILNCGSSNILTDEQHKGFLYCRGLFVGQLQGDYQYGYDLANVDLDRDRQLVEPWSLKREINNVIGFALEKELLTSEQVYNLLNSEREEAKAISDNLWRATTLTKTVSTHFQETFGESAVPVASISESIEADYFGFKNIAVSPALKKTIETQIGTLEARKQERATDVVKRFSITDLTEEERENLTWATNLLGDRYQYTLNVVEFCSNLILGRFKMDIPPVIDISKVVLKDKQETIITIVHELAHISGTDGTVQHRDRIDLIFSEILINQESKWKKS